MKKIGIIIVLAAIFFVSFVADPLKTYNHEKCIEQTLTKTPEKFSSDSESLVIGSLVESHNYGFTSGIGRLSRLYFPDAQDWFYNVQITYKSYIDNKVEPYYDLEKYTSQLGGQGLFYRLIDHLIYDKVGGETSIVIMHMMNVFILSVVLAIIAYYILVTFNVYALIFFIFGMIWNQWIPLTSYNLYWVTWTMFLPMAVACMMTMTQKFKKTFLVLLFLTVFFRCSSGYEYISTVLVAMMIPLIGYEIMNFESIKKSFQHLIIPAVLGVSAFFVALIFHFFRYLSAGTSLEGTIRIMMYIVVKRTHGSLEAIGFKSDVLEKSLQASLGSVLMKYFNATTVNIPINNSYFEVKVWMFLVVIAIGLIVGMVLYRKNHSRKLLAIISMALVSMLAPLSWFVLAKAHSDAHPFVNTMLWYMPFIPLALAALGYILSLKLQKKESSSI